MSLNKRISELEQHTPEDNLVEQVIDMWRDIGVELDNRTANMIAHNIRKTGRTQIAWENLCNISVEMMRQL